VGDERDVSMVDKADRASKQETRRRESFEDASSPDGEKG
jgi:hypothetical protein